MGLCVCLSVRLSQVGVLLKRLNVGSHKQHRTIAQGLPQHKGQNFGSFLQFCKFTFGLKSRTSCPQFYRLQRLQRISKHSPASSARRDGQGASGSPRRRSKTPCGRLVDVAVAERRQFARFSRPRCSVARSFCAM